jgi:hypothetical protein
MCPFRLPLLAVCSSVHVSACRHVSLPCQFGDPWEFGHYLANASRLKPSCPIRRLVPPCRPCSRMSSHRHLSTRSSPRRLALTRPPDSTPSRSDASFPLVRRSLPMTEPRRLGGLLAHEPGRARRANQAARTADPCARGRAGGSADLRGNDSEGIREETAPVTETARSAISAPPSHLFGAFPVGGTRYVNITRGHANTLVILAGAGRMTYHTARSLRHLFRYFFRVLRPSACH